MLVINAFSEEALSRATSPTGNLGRVAATKISSALQLALQLPLCSVRMCVSPGGAGGGGAVVVGRWGGGAERGGWLWFGVWWLRWGVTRVVGEMNNVGGVGVVGVAGVAGVVGVVGVVAVVGCDACGGCGVWGGGCGGACCTSGRASARVEVRMHERGHKWVYELVRTGLGFHMHRNNVEFLKTMPYFLHTSGLFPRVCTCTSPYSSTRTSTGTPAGVSVTAVAAVVPEAGVVVAAVVAVLVFVVGALGVAGVAVALLL